MCEGYMCSGEGVVWGHGLRFCLILMNFLFFRHVSMVNLEPSVGVTKAIRPSALGLATPSMPISESGLCLYSFSFCFSLMPLTGDSLPLCPSDAWPLRWAAPMWGRCARSASCVAWICVNKPTIWATRESTTVIMPTLSSSSKPGWCSATQVRTDTGSTTISVTALIYYI